MKSDNSYDKREEYFVGWYHEPGNEKEQNDQSFFKHKWISYLESHQLISNC